MRLILSIVFLFTCFCIKAETQKVCVYFYNNENSIVDSAYIEYSTTEILSQKDITNPLLKLFRKKQKNNQRIIAAALAFPFPFGIVGLHRIFLGTKPHVPVVYIGTFGGVFGLLPLIDFCALAFDKDFEHYKENGQVFMWIKE